MRERWLPVAGYEEVYEVSNLGKVRSIERCVVEKSRYGAQRTVRHASRVLKAGRCKRGYLVVVLCGNGKQTSVAVHRLVAMAFVEKPTGCDVVNHIDNDPTNNCSNNLEWVTQKENVHHAISIGAKRVRGCAYG